MNINLHKFAIVLKICGDTAKILVSTLSTFVWFFVAVFAMKSLLPQIGLEATTDRMLEIVTPILINWTNFFWVIFLTSIFYEVFQYKKEWKEDANDGHQR